MAVTEMLIRGILSHRTQPALMFLNVAASRDGTLVKARCSLYNTCYTFSRVRLPILHTYAVPMLSQRDAFWSNFSCPPPGRLWMCSKQACNHPLARTHVLLAEMVAGFLLGETAALSNYARTLLPPGLGLGLGPVAQGQGLGQGQGLAPGLPAQLIAPRSHILANRWGAIYILYITPYIIPTKSH